MSGWRFVGLFAYYVLLGALATLGRYREGLSHIAFTALTLLLVLVQAYRSTAA